MRSQAKKTRLFVLVTVVLSAACATTQSGIEGDTYVARKRLARELVARQDWPAAFFYADGLHRERPKDAEVLFLRGTIYREQGLHQEAEADLKLGLALDPRSAEAYSGLGLLYDKSGRRSEAAAMHRKATEINPDNAAYLNNLAFSLFLNGKHTEAVATYQRALRLAPTNRRIRTNLGFAYASVGDWPRAAYELGQGALTPAQAKNNLAFAYERRGDLSAAYRLYVEAVRLDPNCSPARANLVAVATRLGLELPADLPASTEGISKEGRQP
jgi:Flp pilus assembly protein TadD